VDRKQVSQDYILLLLAQDWFPVWFALEKGELLVDLCCNHRLQDQKVKFVRCSIRNEDFITEFSKRVMVMWYLEIDQMRSNALVEYHFTLE
jgi:hypothetical protein